MTISRWILLPMRNVSHKSCRENQNTHFAFSKFRAIYEIIRKSMVGPGRPQTTIIWRMRTACWTTKATHKHSEYAFFFSFQQQQWLRERASVLRLYVHFRSRSSHLQYRISPTHTFCTASVPHVHIVSTISTFVAAMVNKWLYVHPFWHHNTVSLYRHDHRNCHGMSRRMQAP